MAMTRAEIELLIKGRNEASGALNEVNRQVKGVATESEKATSHVSNLGTQTKQTGFAATAAASAMGFFAANIGVQVVNAVSGAIREIATFSSEIQDATSKTGASAEGLQRINQAAKLSGISFGELTMALTQMNNRLSEGNKSTVASVQTLNLSLDDLRKMRPDQAMEAIAEAVGKIPDPMQRTQIAMDLFGRTGANLLPILNGEMKRLGDEAERTGAIMSGDTVKALDDAQDAFDQLIASGKGLLAQVLGPVAQLLNSTIIPLVQMSVDGWRMLFGLFKEFTDTIAGPLTDALETIGLKAMKLPEVTGPATDALNKFKQEVKAAGLEVPKFTGYTEDQIKAIDKETEAIKRNQKEQERLREIRERLFGIDVIRKAEEYVKLIGDTANVTKLTESAQEDVNRTLAEALVAYEKLGRTAPANMAEIERATRAVLKETVPLTAGINNVIGELKKLPPEGVEPATQSFNDLIATMQTLPAEAEPVVSFWRQIKPAVTDTVEHMRTAIQGTFAQMLLGAKGFKDGFIDIWDSLKAGVMNVLNSLLSFFIDNFLKGILGALTGQKGAFQNAFGGLFGGGGGPGGGGGGLLGSLFGGGGGGGFVGPPAPGAAGGGLGALGGILGGAGAFGGAFGLGALLQNLLGRGVGSAAGGAAGGFGTGALIGSIVPGLGTLIGGGIGALGGLLGGIINFGPGKKELEGREAVAAVEEQLASLLTSQQRLEAGGVRWQETVIAVRDAYLKVGKTEADAEAAVKKLWDSSKGGAAAVAEALVPINEAFAKIGTQMEENTQTVVEGTEEINDTLREGQNDWRQYAERGIASGRLIRDALGRVVGVATDVAEGIEDAFNGIRIEIPVDFDVEDIPGLPGGGTGGSGGGGTGGGGTGGGGTGGGGGGGGGYEPPAAAGGVMASRPGLVVFGEGGETEVGGPKAFFRQVFEELGIGATSGPQRGIGGLGVNLTFNVTTLDASGLRLAIERDILPMIIDTVRANRAQARTNFRDVLGVA